MTTRRVRDSGACYKAGVGGACWDQFFRLARRPPLPAAAPAAAEAEEGDEALPAETPRDVLDAVGRSMLLSHIAALYGPPPGGAPPPSTGSPAEDMDNATRQRQAVQRMQHLLSIVRSHQASVNAKNAAAQEAGGE